MQVSEGKTFAEALFPVAQNEEDTFVVDGAQVVTSNLSNTKKSVKVLFASPKCGR